MQLHIAAILHYPAMSSLHRFIVNKLLYYYTIYVYRSTELAVSNFKLKIPTKLIDWNDTIKEESHINNLPY